MIANDCLNLSVAYNKNQFKGDTMAALLDAYQRELEKLIAFCSARETVERTLDLTYPGLTVEALQQLEQRYALEDIYMLTPMQEGMLFHSIYERESAAYFEQVSYRLHGHMEPLWVEKSINELFKRHDILRTAYVFKEMDRPLQLVLNERRVDFTYRDLRGGETDDRGDIETQVRDFKMADRRRSFNLEEDVLMRVTMLHVKNNEYEFVWSFHHILMDGWCLGILVSEYFEIYNSFKEKREYKLPEVKPYGTYINWLSRRDNDASRDYWADYLEGYDEAAVIPGIRERSAGVAGYDKRQFSRVWDRETTAALNGLANQSQVTLNTLFQSLWSILLGRYSGKNDVVFGAVVSGRPPEIDGVESMVGAFLNTIPVRIRHTEGTPFNRLLQIVQKEALDSEPYHYSSLAEVQNLSSLKQNLMDHILVFENYPITQQIDGIGAEAEEEKGKGEKVRTNHPGGF